eukprot:352509_1
MSLFEKYVGQTWTDKYGVDWKIDKDGVPRKQQLNDDNDSNSLKEILSVSDQKKIGSDEIPKKMKYTVFGYINKLNINIPIDIINIILLFYFNGFKFYKKKK